MSTVLSAAHVTPGVGLSGKIVAATIATFFVAVAWGVFVWAAPRGFDLQDESAVLLWISEARVYANTLSQFGFAYHPLYVLLHGDVVLLRLAGSAILAGCAIALGFTLAGREARNPDYHLRTYLSVLSVSAAVLWQFDFWQTVPNYNSLTLSGLLLFCAGLSWWRRIADERGTIVLIACVALTALGLGIVALAKPTSFAVALCTGAAWIVWARPARPFLFAILTVCVLTVFGIVAVYAIDGGVVAFWHRIVSGLALLQSGQSWDVHGIGHSVLAPVLPGRFAKSVVIAGCTAFLFGVDFAALNVVVNGYRPAAKVTAVAAAAAVSLLITALFRAKFGLTAFPGYYAWHFALLALFAAVCTVSLPQLMAHTCRVIKEGVLLAIVPVAYSFGTNNPLFFHMAGASVFWAAAAVAVCNATRRLDLLAATTTLCGAATAGMLLGVVAAPRPSEPPLWKANLAVEIGPDHAKLLVDSDTLDYLRALGTGALQAGFRPGTPILDLSGTGPGFIFFASASAPVTPWLVSDAADTQETARKALSEIPQPVLEQSWIVTGADSNFAVSVGTLQNAGLNFPAGYQRVASAARRQFGWAQTLWKPVRPAVTQP